MLASSILDSLGSAVNTVATGVSIAHGSVAEFQLLTKSLAGGPVTAVLAERQNGGWVATAVAGKDFGTGAVLPSSLAKTLDKAAATLTPAPVVRHGDSSTSGSRWARPFSPRATPSTSRSPSTPSPPRR